MTPCRLVQVVPGIVPGENGLGDYAVTLGRELVSFGIYSSFLVAGFGAEGQLGDLAERRSLSISKTDALDPSAFAESLLSQEADAVLIQMSGYGYHPLGAPMWLVEGLAAYRKLSSARIGTFFHEMWQAPIPWRRSGWRSFSQKQTMIALAELSDVTFTNTERRHDIFNRLLAKPNDICLRVFSNIGEPDFLTEKDPSLAVVFGLPKQRSAVYAVLAGAVDWLRAFGIGRIVDIGPSVINIPKALRDIVDVCGALPPEGVSAILSGAQFGFMNYEPGELAKSGVFNAFCAHALCTINFAPTARHHDGLVPGRHLLLSRDLKANLAEHAAAAHRIGETSREWYRNHNVRVHARSIFDVLVTAELGTSNGPVHASKIAALPTSVNAGKTPPRTGALS